MAFAGVRVYVSRSLLPPQLIDRLHDTLKHNGAHVYLCCDPGARSPDDFHVLFSLDSEKSLDLQAKGCQVIGPECVFECAREQKPLPRRSCTCCFALQGVRIYAAGFDSQVKSRVELYISSTSGVLDSTISSSTDYVVAASVSGSEYRLACSLSKPVVTHTWLEQCFREHRIVPHEPYTLPAFAGLVICATQLPSDERSKTAQATREHGGVYSPDLTRQCTHLIARVPDGKKYEVAKNWGTVKIVNHDWLWQCISAKACLAEELFPLQTASPVQQAASVMAPVLENHSVEQVPAEPFVEDTRFPAEAFEASDLYLADCRCHVAGLEEEDKKRAVDMILDGGGTRFIEFNPTVTHVILGRRPTDSERTYVEKARSWGHIHVVNTIWLEDCTREKREVIVTSEHTAIQLLPSRSDDSFIHKPQRTQSLNIETTTSTKPLAGAESSPNPPESERKVFTGVVFSFSESFPATQKKEVIGWITAGGGSVEDVVEEADYLVAPHGSHEVSRLEIVSFHWVRFCLQASKLVNAGDHLLYRPLPCRVPLPGFLKFKICLSQYGDPERVLSGQLCKALGASYTEVLNKKVTHLLCREAEGEKYQAATQLGIHIATIDWLYTCVAKDTVVSVKEFQPHRLPEPEPVASGDFVRPEKTLPQKTCPAKRKTGSRRDTRREPDAQKQMAADGACFAAWEQLTASWSSGDASFNLSRNSGGDGS